MRFRKLRIAFSATCLIACVLLIALWVRSYWWCDTVCYWSGKENNGIESQCGNLLPFLQIAASGEKWRVISQPIERRVPTFRHKQFSWINQLPSYFSAAIPHWCFALLTVALATLPWLGFVRQFSLRTLLFATTLIAVVLGLIVYATR
jgi:hypothetical protein